MTRITRTAVRCPTCGETIESGHRHDFVKCSCGAIYVDGGQDYARLGGAALETGAWEALYEPRDADNVPKPLAIRGELER